MNRHLKMFVLTFGVVASLLSGTAFAGSFEDLATLHGEYLAPVSGDPARDMDRDRLLSEKEASLSRHLIANPQELREISVIRGILTPDLKKRLIDRLSYEVNLEGRTDLTESLSALRAPAATPILSSENILRIPLRVGNLELSAMFIKKRGSIVRCDKTRFTATLDSITVDVVPDPKNSGKIIATFTGDNPQLPKNPVPGTVRSDGTHASINGEDGTTVEVTYKGNGTYKFTSNKIPVSVSAKYID
ncbi:MAG: hypothetical protein WA705_09495 [Candidatus Ozemobacteraceae bacterium]